MITYRTRLKAALRSRGASEDTVAGVLSELPETEDEAVLIDSFGEPEDYADAVTPDGKDHQFYAFIVAGTVLAVVLFFGVYVAAADGSDLALTLRPFVGLISLGIMGLGVLIDFLRYVTRGRK